MGFWKFACTCAGCVAGLVCIAVTGGTATPLVTAIAVGIGGFAGHGVGHKIEQEEKKTKNQEQITANQTKVIENLTKENQEVNSELSNKNKKLEEVEKRIEDRDKKIEEARRKSQDPNLSEEDRRKWRNELTVLLAQQDDDKKERDNIIKSIKELQDKISSNNNTISSVSSGSHDKVKKDIWEFITLENILIVVAIYALWQIVRDNKR